MPREARDLPADSVSHLLSRGVERRAIFLKAGDYRYFLTQMRDAFFDFGLHVLNYALMPNHFHIQALNGKVPVGKAMHRLLTRYALYFNDEYARVGHLFQNRFKSFEVRDDAYLVQLPVYLSRNPVRAGLAAKAGDWEWSGHNELVSGSSRFINLSRLEEVTGMPGEEWRQNYLALIARGEPTLGAEPDLEAVLAFASQSGGVSERDVRSGVRGRPFAIARRLFAREALKRGFSRREIADALGCAPASVTEMLAP